MKYILVLLAFFSLYAKADLVADIQQKEWNHGSKNCKKNKDQPIDILQVESATYILRQNKCIHYEAPFIYVLFGQHSVFIQDTGATEDPDLFPLYKTIESLILEHEKDRDAEPLKVIVSHSHSHSDHYAGDTQFIDRANITLIEPNSEAVRTFFGFQDWPNGLAKLDLGGRELEIMPLPGHQADALAVYDSRTNFILSGDSFYPGRLYIKHWDDFKTSVAKLLVYAEKKSVAGFLGTHIEMKNKPGKDYRIGTKYQPNEKALPLSLTDLSELHSEISAMGDKPVKKALENVIIYPLD